jgi:hypothetical protein
VTTSESATWRAPVEVGLTTDLLGGLSEHERSMLPLLEEACAEMDDIFWQEAYGDRDALLSSIEDPEVRRFAAFNYGPWERRNGNAPFVPDVGPKPAGAGFYPMDMTNAEFEAACAESPERAASLRSQYTLVRRDETGGLVAVPYREAFAAAVERAASKLRAAAALADDQGLRQYLELRAVALLTDDYRPSDAAWLDMKSNAIEVIIGPVEDYEDTRFGCKTAHEGAILLKDRSWSARLSRLNELLPDLQRGLPVPDAYRQEIPGSDGELGVYDALAYTGHANAIPPDAVTLPNDEDLQLAKGSRRLQIKNAMLGIFDSIVAPTADRLIPADQRDHVRFDAYFEYVMCHEIAHGLGIKHTVGGTQLVREALQNQHSVIEEAKADIVGLHLLAELKDAGELPGVTLEHVYATFVVEMLRQIRRGSASEYARAGLSNLGFFMAAGAIDRDDGTGTYGVNVPAMRMAIDSLSERYLRMQGDGDYDASLAFVPKEMELGPILQGDIDRLEQANIPKAIAFLPAVDAFA